jgi:hypothetical protein
MSLWYCGLKGLRRPMFQISSLFLVLEFDCGQLIDCDHSPLDPAHLRLGLQIGGLRMAVLGEDDVCLSLVKTAD